MLDCSFYSCVRTIDDTLFQRINLKSYKAGCTVPLDELRYISLSHYGFDGKIHMGELIVNHAIVQKNISIFQELFEAKYPIEKIFLVDEYDADDICSMADNNSSCFNYRTIEGTNKLSNHSLGLAIDINPLYNPYVRTIDGKLSVLPENGTPYVNRSDNCPYFIHKNDICYNAFIKHGFTWGGAWESTKDYQHFEIKL